MANEAEFLTINQAGNSWVDASPGAESTGYQPQNTNIEARTLGQDDTHIEVSGTNLILDPSGVIDDNGIPIVIKSQITLSTITDTTHYIAVVAGSSTTQRSLSIVTTAGLWDVSKNGYYESGVRILNWEIRNVAGVVTYYKRIKPESGLIVPRDLIVGNDGSIGNDLTVGNDLIASGAISGASIDTGDGAVELNQNLRTTDPVEFQDITTGAIDTGQGFNELYGMDQGVKTTDDIIHKDITSTGHFIPNTSPSDSQFGTNITGNGTNIVYLPEGIYIGLLAAGIGSGTGDSTVYIEKYMETSSSGWKLIKSINNVVALTTEETEVFTVISSGAISPTDGAIRIRIVTTGTTAFCSGTFYYTKF